MSYFPFWCLLFTLDDDYSLPYVLLSSFSVLFFALDHDYSLLCALLSVLVPVGSFVCCVSCFVCRPFSCGNCCLFVVSPCLYPCRFACTLFSVPRMGVGVWGVGVVLLGLPGFFWGRASALWVCVP